MSTIRSLKKFFEANIEAVIKVPLRKAAGIKLGLPALPSDYGLTSTKNTVIPVEYDNRKYLVCYNRIDFQSWFTFNQYFYPHLPIPVGVTTLAQLAPEIARVTGIPVTAEQIVDGPLDTSGTTVTIPLKNHEWFTGSMVFSLYARQGTAYAVDWNPNAYRMANSAGNIGLLTYGIDYTAQATALAAIGLENFTRTAGSGGSTWAATATALNAVDGLGWTSGGTPGPFSLYGSQVIYNGPTQTFRSADFLEYMARGVVPDPRYLKYDTLVDTTKQNVLVVLLNVGGTKYCTNYDQALFIHYGVKPAFVETPYRDPLHYWPLQSDYSDLGTASTPWAAPMTFGALENGDRYATPAAQTLAALGSSLPINKDFTLSFEYYYLDNSLASDIFSSGSRAAGTIEYVGINGYLCQYGETTGGTVAVDLCKRGYLHKYALHYNTIVRTGQIIKYYVNGELVRTVNAAANYLPADLTHFGKLTSGFGANGIANVSYYDYALSPAQVKRLNRGLYGNRL